MRYVSIVQTLSGQPKRSNARRLEIKQTTDRTLLYIASSPCAVIIYRACIRPYNVHALWVRCESSESSGPIRSKIKSKQSEKLETLVLNPYKLKPSSIYDLSTSQNISCPFNPQNLQLQKNQGRLDNVVMLSERRLPLYTVYDPPGHSTVAAQAHHWIQGSSCPDAEESSLYAMLLGPGCLCSCYSLRLQLWGNTCWLRWIQSGGLRIELHFNQALSFTIIITMCTLSRRSNRQAPARCLHSSSLSLSFVRSLLFVCYEVVVDFLMLPVRRSYAGLRTDGSSLSSRLLKTTTKKPS